jgi:hypothetical protein
MMKFEGKWKYQSYRPDPGSFSTESLPPTLVRWSPPGIVTVDEDGSTGKLQFTAVPITLDLKLQVIDGSPGKLIASAVMKLPSGGQFTNELQGWFVPAKLGEEISSDNPLVVRGSIVQTSQDIAKPSQPMYTTGFFVLEPQP